MRISSLFTIIFVVTASLSGATQRAKLLNIAQSCTTRALKCRSQSAEQQRLDALSSACLEVLTLIKDEKNTDACVALLAPFAPVRSQKHVTVPVDALIEMIEAEEAEVHLAATPLQLTAKRIIFRTFIELFYAFGMSKIILQQETKRALHPEDRPDHTQPTTSNPLERLKHYLGSELMFSRSQIGLRVLRIMSNEFVDQLTPNPHARQWQQYLELLLPIAVAHIVTYGILRNTNDSVKILVDGLAQEMILRLFMVQFFMTKFSMKSVMIMMIIYVLAFYNSSAGKRIWRDNGERPGETGMQRRTRYVKSICENKDNFVSVLVDGLSSLALYKLIDTGVSALKLPDWMHLTPIKHQCPHEEESDTERNEQPHES